MHFMASRSFPVVVNPSARKHMFTTEEPYSLRDDDDDDDDMGKDANMPIKKRKSGVSEVQGGNDVSEVVYS